LACAAWHLHQNVLEDMWPSSLYSQRKRSLLLELLFWMICAFGAAASIVIAHGNAMLQRAEYQSHIDLRHLTASNVYVAELDGYKVFRVSLAREREAIPRWTEPIARFLEDLVGHRLVRASSKLIAPA
jgi:hypothetical protein